MALRLWASSTANALKLSSAASRTHQLPSPFSLSRCFSTVLDGLKYANSHEWVKHEGSVATIGITDHAQDHLGEVVFVDLPEPGGSVKQGGSFGAVESVKATSDVNSPISGEIIEINASLKETPGLRNTTRRDQTTATPTRGTRVRDGVEVRGQKMTVSMAYINLSDADGRSGRKRLG
ncbi:glycine cleavage system H protein, mitochondrial isoform X1 [Arachis ipaensis]|uniref:glycine cleavage system H protein, mitochondrial isoform X1 n=1 Tax=Arachis ipaensis TaxID=130454 RepID=UPI000A2B7BD1|nr:glycine cleavage system H protein, mitochondrial isoform X1 [Arachis ipaensis]